ncbi:N-acetylglutaminylglutamine synthetase [Mycobacterium sp. SMC-18]|uniref:N-acetylglutaminylglutamine synthetase n=1 Tax=Mycobacteriaceae TaxID=1762 RepID=UPI001BB432B0|nr:MULTISPECIES: N-acetylglutaminylglutamine synthetase [unclassified Mycolicibacterium]MDX1877787.1 N-acetylglutaminylglutamine synthetase [Mycolicibacterium sp. 141076]BCI81229.1 GNAT family N-acetyltransferase [Mycolicibacterium sp. TY66]BCJ81113.1 GNAT family N-acetyltransferase [Mycolicibacterium sp. TY81]
MTTTETTDRAEGVIQDMGWGRLVFGQTFHDPDAFGTALREEGSGRRDIGMYLDAPHVFVALHSHEFFIDPSFTYRLDLTKPMQYRPPDVPGLTVRQVNSLEDCVAINHIYVRCHMVPADSDLMWTNSQTAPQVVYLVAVDDATGQVVGTVTGIDHRQLFGDPENGSSLWCLAVDPAVTRPGTGGLLVRSLIEEFVRRGRAQMDLSVLHDNDGAIALYERIGFARVPAVLGIKRKNAINEALFAPVKPEEELAQLNPYARIIADEAILRGIAVDVLDAQAGYLRLTHGGTSIVTRESLSELTSAVAMSRCDDKRIARSVVAEAGIRIPEGCTATFTDEDCRFLEKVGSAVVKPARGEQGAGITVGVTTPDELNRAIGLAVQHCPDVLIEERCEGEDLRIIVIDGKVIAAALRRPPEVIGTGTHTIRQLIEAQSRRRSVATHGESVIPLDSVTDDTVHKAGWQLDDVLPANERLIVRHTANLHTGGTIHDVTDELNPMLAKVAVDAAAAIEIPVTGIDLIVPSVSGEEYVFIEANERPGLANHEPRPTAQAFIDLLFPRTAATPWAWHPDPIEQH